MSDLGNLLLWMLVGFSGGLVITAIVASLIIELRKAQVLRRLTRRVLRLFARRRLPRSIRRHLPRYGASAQPNYLLIAAMEAECALTETRRTCPSCGFVMPSAEDACQHCGVSAQQVARHALRLLDVSQTGGWTAAEFARAVERTFSAGEHEV